MAAQEQRFEIPSEMRAFAERSVEQAKQAFDGFISAAHQAVSTMEGQAETARKGASQVTEKAMNFAEQNVARSFEFAQQLVRAKDVQEVMKLQAEYVRTQLQVFTEQARELGETAGKAAANTATPPRS
jgi:phasin